MICSWVEESWISKFSIVVFLVQSFLSGLRNFDEVGKILLICEVLVKIIFKMLDQVHVVLYEVKSSYSWEWESLIIKFPSMNWNSWRFAFLFKLIVDFDSVVVILDVKASGEEIEFDIKLFLSESKWCTACIVIIFSIDNNSLFSLELLDCGGTYCSQ